MNTLLLRARLFVVLARPPLLVLLAMSGALGAASAGGALDVLPALRAFAVVVPFVVYAVSLNDLADVEIDRVNLAGDPSRPLAADTGSSGDVRRVAAGSLLIALALAWSVSTVALAVTAAGLLVTTAYSAPMVALSRRGLVAPLVLPLGMLAVPFAVGVEAAGGGWGSAPAALLAALYVGFVGRLLVKDFRDVRGDALFGKRTFLVRHGRAATCLLSASLWSLGSVALLVVPLPSPALVLCWSVLLLVALALLLALSRPSDPRRDERLVSALAVCGRALVLLLLLHLALVEQAASPRWSAALLFVTTVLLVLSAADIAVHGPRSRATVQVVAVSSTPGSTRA